MQDPIIKAKARRLAARKSVELSWRDQTHLSSSKEAMTHKVSVALMKFLSNVARRLGVAEHVYVVGGAVRNFVIDQPIKDIDVVVDSIGAGKDSDWFAAQVGRAIPAQTSLTTNQYGVAILTVKGDWIVEGVNLKGEVLEIANARKESYGGAGGKGYKPHMVEPATIEEDVVRREFSFNTLMWRLLDLAEGPDKAEIIDLTGCGLRDLQQGVARCPSPPDKTFADDPTRMLRAIKFFVKYGLKVSPDVEASIRKNAPTLKNAPHEAISSLLIDTILHEKTAIKGLQEMKRLGLLEVVADMVRTIKPFRATMENWASNQKVLLLFDMMELGLPLSARLGFLTREQQLRLRQVALGMGPGDPERFLAILKQPGRLADMKYLIQKTGLKGSGIQKLNEAIREALLADPDLRFSPRKLNQVVLASFKQSRRASGRGPSTLPMKGKKPRFFVYGDDAGNWELSPFADFGALRAGKWQATAALAARNDWRNLAVDNATEHHRGFRKALNEMVAKYPEIRDYLIMFDGGWMPVSKLVGAAKPEVDLSTITFYHGTSGAAWEKIQREGLRPRSMTKADPVFGVGVGAQPGKDHAIYLTTQPNTALFAAREAARVTRSDLVVLKVTGLSPDRFLPDEDSREETALSSLERMGSVAYTDVIPPSNIRLHYVEEAYRETPQERLAREFADRKQLREYLRKHPGADPKNHTVKQKNPQRNVPKGTKSKLKKKLSTFKKQLKAQVADTKELTKTLAAITSGKKVSDEQRGAVKRQVGDVFKMLVLGATGIAPIPGSGMAWPVVVAAINKVFSKEYDWKPTAFQKSASEDAILKVFEAVLAELEEETSKEARPTTNTVAIEALVKEFNDAFPRVRLWGDELEAKEMVELQKALRNWVPVAKRLVPYAKQWEIEDERDAASFPKRRLTNIRKFLESVAKAKTVEDLEEFLRKVQTKSKTPWEKWWEMSNLLRGLIRGYDVELEGKFDLGGFRVRMWSDPASDWSDEKIGNLRWLLTQTESLLKRAGAGKALGIRVLAFPGDRLPKNYAGNHSATAAYQPAQDVMAIASGQDPRRALRSVVHELGHRYYYKVMDRTQRDEWRAFYDAGFGTPEDLDGIIARWERSAEENDIYKWLMYYAQDIRGTKDFHILSMIRRKGFFKEEKWGGWSPKGIPGLELIKAKKGEIKVYLHPVGTGYSGSSASELFAESFAWGITKGKGVMPEIVQDAFGKAAPKLKLARSNALEYVYDPKKGFRWETLKGDIMPFNGAYKAIKWARSEGDLDMPVRSYIKGLAFGSYPTSGVSALGFWVRRNWPYMSDRKGLVDASKNLGEAAESMTAYLDGKYSRPNSLLGGIPFEEFKKNLLVWMDRYIQEVNGLLAQAGPRQFTRHGIKIYNPERLPEHTIKALMLGVDFVVALFKKRGAEGILEKTVSEVVIRHRAREEGVLGWYHFGLRRIEMLADAVTAKNPRMLKTWVEEVFLHEIGHHVHRSLLPNQAYAFWNSGWAEAERVEKDKKREIKKYNDEVRDVTGDDRKRYWDLLVQAKADLRKVRLKGLDRMKFHAWLSNPSYNDSLVTPKQLRWKGDPWIPRFIRDPEGYVRQNSWVDDAEDLQQQVGRHWERAQDWLGVGPGWESISAPRLTEEEVSKYIRLDSEIHEAVMEALEPLHVPTGYATTNKFEDFAETFVAFMAAPERLSDVAKFRMQKTLSLASLYGKPVMRLAHRYIKAKTIEELKKEYRAIPLGWPGEPPQGKNPVYGNSLLDSDGLPLKDGSIVTQTLPMYGQSFAALPRGGGEEEVQWHRELCHALYGGEERPIESEGRVVKNYEFMRDRFDAQTAYGAEMEQKGYYGFHSSETDTQGGGRT